MPDTSAKKPARYSPGAAAMLCAVAAASLYTTRLARTTNYAKKPQPMQSTYSPPEILALRRADVSGIRLLAIYGVILAPIRPTDHPCIGRLTLQVENE
jgi:hypothetical protein